MYDLPKPARETAAPYIPTAASSSPLESNPGRGEITVPDTGPDILPQTSDAVMPPAEPEIPDPSATIPDEYHHTLGEAAVGGIVGRAVDRPDDGIGAPDNRAPDEARLEASRRLEAGSASQELIAVPRFIYDGPLAASASTIAAWEAHVEAGRSMEFFGESPPNYDDTTRSAIIVGAAERVSERLGLSIAIPQPHEIHYFGRIDRYRRAVALNIGEQDTDTRGINHPTLGSLILKSQGDEIATASTTCHEVGHDMGQVRVTLDALEAGDGAIPTWTAVQEGYTGAGGTPDSGSGANEAATDMLMNEIAIEAGYDETIYYYGPILAITHGIIDRTAKVTNKAPQDVAAEFMKGRLTGDHTTLHSFRDAIGSARMDIYLSFTGDETYEQMAAIAEAWDLPSAQRMITAAQAHEDFDPTRWD
jgi:hypothetical protein